MVGVKTKLRMLHGAARDNYLKGWANRVREECIARGLRANCLEYDLDDLKSVEMMLLDYCDDLTDSECWDALVEAIRERGGMTKEEEWLSAYEEWVSSGEALPSDIRDLLLSDLETMYRKGASEAELYDYAVTMLEDYEVPNAEEIAARLVEEVIGRKPEIERKEIKPPEPIVVGRKEIPPVGALMVYVLVSRPTKWAREVQGEVEIGEVGGRKVYLIVPSETEIVEVREVKPNKARVVVRRGWIEIY